MTQDLENQLKRMLSELDEDLPAAEFSAQVMSHVRKPRGRERLLRGSAVLAALAFLWFAFPHLDAGFRLVAGLPRTLFDCVRETVPALAQSPLVYVYGMALGGYVLLRLMRRLQIRPF